MAAPTTTPTARYLRGPITVGNYPAGSGLQINPGDGVYWRSGDAAPVSAYPMLSGGENQTHSGLRSQYLGTALGQHNAGQIISGQHGIAVIHGGVFKYPGKVQSGVSYQPGTFVSFSQDLNSGYFNPQQLMQCSGQAAGVGKVVELTTPATSGVGDLIVQLQSTVTQGGMGN